MKVLHIEDFDPKKGKDYSKALKELLDKENIEYKNLEYLSEVKELDVNEYDLFVMDGMFPENPDAKPNVSSFFLLFDFLKSKKISKNKMIVWSNSTRVHAFCFENNLKYFSKKKYFPENYIKKNVDPKVISKMATEFDIFNLIKHNKFYL